MPVRKKPRPKITPAEAEIQAGENEAAWRKTRPVKCEGKCNSNNTPRLHTILTGQCGQLWHHRCSAVFETKQGCTSFCDCECHHSPRKRLRRKR